MECLEAMKPIGRMQPAAQGSGPAGGRSGGQAGRSTGTFIGTAILANGINLRVTTFPGSKGSVARPVQLLLLRGSIVVR